MTDLLDLDVQHAVDLPPPLAQRIPHAKALGMRYLPQKDKRHVFHLGFDDSLVGNTFIPALHGGAVAAFMESAGLFQLLLEHSDASRLPKIIDFNIDYLRAAGPHDSFALAEVARVGRRVALMHIRCWQDDYDRPCALARAQYHWEALPTGETNLQSDTEL